MLDPFPEPCRAPFSRYCGLCQGGETGGPAMCTESRKGAVGNRQSAVGSLWPVRLPTADCRLPAPGRDLADQLRQLGILADPEAATVAGAERAGYGGLEAELLRFAQAQRGVHHRADAAGQRDFAEEHG